MDPHLLRRIESRLGTSLTSTATSQESVQEAETTRLQLARQRALARQRTLFGTKPTARPTRPTRGPQRFQEPQRNRLLGGGQCQALKTENRLLKQKLIQQGQEEQKSTTAIDVLKQLHDQGHFEEPRSLGGAAPLEQLLAESSNKQERGGRIQVVDGLEIKSILITPTPTLSTLLNTVSFTTTVTQNISKEIGIYFGGRRIPTHVIEQVLVVQTSSSVLSTTMEITPTPTWQTITVTPTVTVPPTPPPPPPVDFQALLQQKVDTCPILTIPITGGRATGPAGPPTESSRWGEASYLLWWHPGRGCGDSQEAGHLHLAAAVPGEGRGGGWLSIQALLQVRQQKAQGEGPTILAQPLVQEPPSLLPSTTVSTIFISGSRPGEYSTSLVTLSLTPETARHRREASSLPSVATVMPELPVQVRYPNDPLTSTCYRWSCRAVSVVWCPQHVSL